jgi:hypothetical protein
MVVHILFSEQNIYIGSFPYHSYNSQTKLCLYDSGRMKWRREEQNLSFFLLFLKSEF